MALINADASPLRPLRLLREAARDEAGRLAHFRFVAGVIRDQPVDFVTCAHFLEVAFAAGRLPVAEQLIEQRVADVANGTRQWAADNFLGRVANTGEYGPILTRLKYGVERFDGRETVLEMADRIAPRVAIKQVVLDKLYAARSDPSEQRLVWEHKVRRAFALDHIVQDQHFLAIDMDRHLLPHIDMQAWQRIVDTVSATGPVVFLTFHSGLLAISRWLYEREGSWMTLQARNTRNGMAITAADDPRTALFVAFREVQNGKTLLFAPDGPWGAQTEQLNVLGARSSAAVGAAFIAYELKRPMLWINVERRGDMLVPVVAEGPRRLEGENYAAYTARWNRFYSGQIEAVFTGNPDSLVVRPHWTRLLLRETHEQV